MMSYIIIRGRRCHIIVLNIRAPSQDKINGVLDSFYEEMESVFDKKSPLPESESELYRPSGRSSQLLRIEGVT
jgi:hypothetical protein